MRLRLGIGLFTLTFAALAEPSIVVAAPVVEEAERQPSCDLELDAHCSVPLPPPEYHCADLTGECAIDNTPQDFLWCECADGTSDGLVGGSTWAGYSSEEMLAQCEQALVSMCSVPPPVLECTSRLGSCTITASPNDHLECGCDDGAAFVVDGGNEWAGLSEDELLMVCEQELATGCAIGEETSDSGDSDGSSDTGDSDDGAGDTGGSTDTGEPGDTGSDGHGGTSEGSTTEAPDSTTTGDDATSTASGGSNGEGSDGDGSDGDGSDGDGGAGNGGRGCSIAPRSASSGVALALLGLLALGRRRRRAG